MFVLYNDTTSFQLELPAYSDPIDTWTGFLIEFLLFGEFFSFHDISENVFESCPKNGSVQIVAGDVLHMSSTWLTMFGFHGFDIPVPPPYMNCLWTFTADVKLRIKFFMNQNYCEQSNCTTVVFYDSKWHKIDKNEFVSAIDTHFREVAIASTSMSVHFWVDYFVLRTYFFRPIRSTILLLPTSKRTSFLQFRQLPYLVNVFLLDFLEPKEHDKCRQFVLEATEPYRTLILSSGDKPYSNNAVIFFFNYHIRSATGRFSYQSWRKTTSR